MYGDTRNRDRTPDNADVLVLIVVAAAVVAVAGLDEVANETLFGLL